MADELRQLSEFICGFDPDGADEEILRAARFCVLDSVGAALGAACHRDIRSIGREYRQWAGPGRNGRTADIWGQACRDNLFTALMVNSLMSHELELDDVHTLSKSHVGAVVVPTAWTLSDALQADGRSLLAAVIVGYEVMGRVGKAMDVSSNRKRGWHTTGVIGTFGAAAAAARLLGLSADQTLSALGMAGTQSSGLWAFLAEGATCKKLHPARAALNGLSACLLAKSGMTGPAHILDAADGGLYRAVSDSFDMSRLTEGLGAGYEICRIDKKPYPCCRTTHHAIDAALALRAGLDPQDIRSVLVETYDVGVLQCGSPKYPSTPVEARFSIPYTSAAAFVKGRVSLAEFSPDVIGDPLIRRIAEATTVTADSLFTSRYPKRWGCRMTVTLSGGDKLVRQVDDMSGSLAAPLTEKQETDKFNDLAAPVLGHERAALLVDDILRLEQLSNVPVLA